MNDEYIALRDRVDGFAKDVAERRADAMSCRAGCESCCHVRLDLCDVEADSLRVVVAELDPEVLLQLEAHLDAADGDRCVLLGPDGRCAAYAGRPLVCRTQGLPLRYPADTVPVEALRGSANGDVTWCPLNFEDAVPGAEDVLDAERVDLILAVINRRSAEDPLRRTTIEAIVRQMVTQAR